MKNKIKYFIDLLLVMTEKEIRARYKYTIFGFFWIILNPLLQMIVIGFIFTFFIKEKVENYYQFLFVGLLTWNFYSLSLTKVTPCIVYERALIKKAKFPQVVIPLAIIFSNLFHFLTALGLFLIPAFLLNFTNLGKLFLLLPAVLLLLTLSIGVSLIACTLNVKYRDVNFFVQALLILWFYATPIIYPLNFIPENIRWLWYLNPLTGIVQLIQQSFLSQESPNIQAIFFTGLFVFSSFVAGLVLFNNDSKNFDDYI